MLDLKALRPELLKQLGVVEWGYNEEPQAVSYSQFIAWINKKEHLPLHYMADERAKKRQSLREVFSDFRSSISFLFPYDVFTGKTSLKIANYVWGYDGLDYHRVLRVRLEKIAQLLTTFPETKYKIVLDIEPVLERDLAYRSGLGWVGKNSMLINKKWGSSFLIGSILFNQRAGEEDLKELSKSIPQFSSDHCGSCTACIQACPTQVINPETRTIQAEKCLSTFTIEVFKQAQPPQGFKEANYMFGCDICQDVCPWNRKNARQTGILQGEKSQEMYRFFFSRPLEQVVADLQQMSNREYKRKFYRTSLERTGRVGLLKNLKPFLEDADNMGSC